MKVQLTETKQRTACLNVHQQNERPPPVWKLVKGLMASSRRQSGPRWGFLVAIVPTPLSSSGGEDNAVSTNPSDCLHSGQAGEEVAGASPREDLSALFQPQPLCTFKVKSGFNTSKQHRDFCLSSPLLLSRRAREQPFSASSTPPSSPSQNTIPAVCTYLRLEAQSSKTYKP